MPAYCITYGCDHDQHASPDKSFHHLLLKKPLLLKQLIMLTGECYHCLEFNKWLEKFRSVDLLICEANTCACSNHFTETCYAGGFWTI